jgi:hypothetical protein
MPLLVFVSSEHLWDSRWKLAQMAWWGRAMPAMGQWPEVYKRVTASSRTPGKTAPRPTPRLCGLMVRRWP